MSWNAASPGIAILDYQVPTVHITKLTQSFEERLV
jgi:hypothetical protein